MAFTVSKTFTVMGNMRVSMLNITADGAESNVETGLGRIINFSIGAKSLTTALAKIYANSNSTGVAANGTLGISGVASGDELFIICYGV